MSPFPRWADLHPPTVMSPFPRWADLHPDLLCCIGDRIADLKSYASARASCTAWRRSLAPPSPTLLVAVAADDRSRWRCWRGRWRLYTASLPTRRSFELTHIVEGSRCVGASKDGWLALSLDLAGGQTGFVLLNPVTAVEIPLPPMVYKSLRNYVISKVVFAPSPARNDFAAAAICDNDRVAYVTAGATRWAVMDPVVGLTTGDILTDVVYTEQGHQVYCLTKYGDVYVLSLPERRRRATNVVDAAAGPSLEPELSVLHHSRTVSRWKHYERKLQMMHHLHLNAPATVEPLLSEDNLPFNPARVFAPPYDIVASFTSAKNLVFCEGNLYQVWRNESCTVTLRGGRHRVAENEILVLRYYPQRQPCWDLVKDLGGHSLFVGRNNAVSMYAKGVPGLRGNCVYWIGGRDRDQGMVFDMESGRSTPCTVGFLPQQPHSTICWYFLSDVCNEYQHQLQQSSVS